MNTAANAHKSLLSPEAVSRLERNDGTFSLAALIELILRVVTAILKFPLDLRNNVLRPKIPAQDTSQLTSQLLQESPIGTIRPTPDDVEAIRRHGLQVDTSNISQTQQELVHRAVKPLSDGFVRANFSLDDIEALCKKARELGDEVGRTAAIISISDNSLNRTYDRLKMKYKLPESKEDLPAWLSSPEGQKAARWDINVSTAESFVFTRQTGMGFIQNDIALFVSMLDATKAKETERAIHEFLAAANRATAGRDLTVNIQKELAEVINGQSKPPLEEQMEAEVPTA